METSRNFKTLKKKKINKKKSERPRQTHSSHTQNGNNKLLCLVHVYIHTHARTCLIIVKVCTATNQEQPEYANDWENADDWLVDLSTGEASSKCPVLHCRLTVCQHTFSSFLFQHTFASSRHALHEAMHYDNNTHKYTRPGPMGAAYMKNKIKQEAKSTPTHASYTVNTHKTK